jgi:hypothetical protein
LSGIDTNQPIPRFQVARDVPRHDVDSLLDEGVTLRVIVPRGVDEVSLQADYAAQQRFSDAHSALRSGLIGRTQCFQLGAYVGEQLRPVISCRGPALNASTEATSGSISIIDKAFRAPKK